MAAQEASDALLALQPMGDRVSDVYKEFNRLRLALQSSQQAFEESASSVKAASDLLERAHAEAASSKLSLQELTHLKADLTASSQKLCKEDEQFKLSNQEKIDKVAAMQASIAALQATISQGGDWTPAQKARKRALEAECGQVKAILKEKQATQSALQRDVSALSEHIRLGLEARASIIAEKDDAQASTAAVLRSVRSLESKKEHADVELKSLQRSVDSSRAALIDKEAQVAAGEEDVARRERAVKQLESQSAQVLQTCTTLMKRAADCTDELDAQLVRSQGVVMELNTIEERAQAFRKECIAVEVDTEKFVKLHDLAVQHIASTSEKQEKVDAESAEIVSKLAELRTAADALEAQHKISLRGLMDLQKERDVLQATLQDAGARGVKLETLLAMQASSQKLSENELSVMRSVVRKCRDDIADLHASIGLIDVDHEATQGRLAALQEKLKLQQIQATLLQKKMELAEAKSTQQQAMYDAIRKERTKYSKALLDIEEEIAEISAAFKMLSFRIDLSKDDLAIKDNTLVKVHFEHHQVQKEIDGLRAELSRTKRNVHAADVIAQSQEAEMKKLAAVVEAADVEKCKQVKECAAVVAEKDLLLAQFTKREVELTQLYEKLGVQASSLEKGKHVFLHRKSEEEAVIAQVAALKRELQESNLQISSLKDLKKHILTLEQELRQEQLRGQALQQELHRPINVHRWRQLESSKPELFELISRVQKLQKRLLECSESVDERDALIKQKEGLYVELKTLLSRQPDSEASERLLALQQAHKQKIQQLHSMESELLTQKSTVQDQKRELEFLNEQIQALEIRFLRRMKT